MLRWQELLGIVASERHPWAIRGEQGRVIILLYTARQTSRKPEDSSVQEPTPEVL
jgi:hypothetical protein